MKFILKAIVKLIFRVETYNFEKLMEKGPMIIMPNHVSFLDGFFLYLFLPREVVFVVNTLMARRFSFFMRFVRHVTIDQRDPYAIRDIIHYVSEDVPLVLFPEGRITTTKGLMKIYDGVGFVAAKTGATLFPLAINGLEYSKFSRVKSKVRSRWFPRVKLFVDSPISLTLDKGKEIKSQRRAASDKIYRSLQRALCKSMCLDGVNLFNEIVWAAGIHGWDKVALEDLKAKITYKKLILNSYVLGRKFKSIVGSDDTVGVLLPNAIAHVVTLLGLFYINKTPAILNFSAGTRNILDCAETSGIKTVLTSREFVEKGGFTQLIEILQKHYKVCFLEDIRAKVGLADKLSGLGNLICRRKAASAPDNRLILFTSGSESKPKGVVLRHDNIYNNVMQAINTLDFGSQDIMFNALPMFHSFGLTAGTLLPLLSGAGVFLYPSPLHFKVIPDIAYEVNATVILGTSMFFAGYGKYAHPFDFHSVRYAIVGAEKLKDDVRELWNDKFGIRILEGYGCTETAPILSLNTPLYFKKGSVGKMLPGIDYRVEPVEGIAEGGNLLVRGPNVMEGYLIHGRGFVPTGEWYDTGDIVRIDDQGYIYITSRLKRFAKISGEMVSLNQIEELAEKCFGSDIGFAAVSLSDPTKGEKVVLIATDDRVEAKTFRQYLLNNQYSMLLSPERVIYLESIPVLGSGKTDYVSLKEMLEGENQISEQLQE